LELRPARFVLGLEEPLHWSKLKEANGAPVNGAFYIGRVEEVTDDEVLATVWERPSGREATTFGGGLTEIHPAAVWRSTHKV